MMFLEAGSLWPLAVRRAREAVRSGAMQPIETVSERVEQADVRFIVRVVSSLRKKPHKTTGNPFLPYDKSLFVADMSDTHVCVLNKYNVLEHHLLFITRDYEDQELPLTRNDFAAMAAALEEIDGLAFYNSGAGAGASQPHRHLQLVPLPFAHGEKLPMAVLIEAALSHQDERQTLPFRYAIAPIQEQWLGTTDAAVSAMQNRYFDLLETAGVVDDTPPDPSLPLPPYNLLVTREWMLVVPRFCERWQDVSINALGFAGSFFVRNRRQLQAIRQYGPMNVLRSVSMSPIKRRT